MQNAIEKFKRNEGISNFFIKIKSEKGDASLLNSEKGDASLLNRKLGFLDKMGPGDFFK